MPHPRLADVKAFTFDVFGTCVDWRTSVKTALGAFIQDESTQTKFADQWRQGYIETMGRLAKTLTPDDTYPALDTIHREILDRLVVEYNLTLTSSEAEQLNLVWHRLAPWPDTPAGLARLNQHALTATLSNGSVRLLADLKRFGQLPFDVILSAELFHAYKPSPRIYQGAAKMLELKPEEVCMVAAHGRDLEAAKAVGFKTAYVHRPGEGHSSPEAVGNESYVDVSVDSIEALARLLDP
ncbi:2-haloalkanoic acid dehalogenase, type II [Syncephalastrum racemosum]|uniref:2-haloalkanoic acid dehalogenase, type II n=1 Tax=Syncephalastrum racemosum TaxID=13706 RepID=A0A1X2H0R2_SYNRA|nr:2-haloalkanoic acid dehalogenase, type II [Syncephalastrum racemosum]